MAALLHTVAQGECIRTIANRHGFADPEVIWRHDDNAELRKRRPSANVLAPGDQVAIPDREEKVVDCAAGRVHRFVVRRPTRDLRVVFIDALGAAVAGTPYVLVLGDEERRGTTGSDGAVDEKNLGLDVDVATLHLTDLGIRRVLRVGHLDPHHEDTGWRQRLENLGYPGDEEGLAAFAGDQALPEDADADAVREKLRAAHRC